MKKARRKTLPSPPASPLPLLVSGIRRGCVSWSRYPFVQSALFANFRSVMCSSLGLRPLTSEHSPTRLSDILLLLQVMDTL